LKEITLLLGITIISCCSFYLGYLFKSIKITSYNNKIAIKVSNDIIDYMISISKNTSNIEFWSNLKRKVKNFVLLELDK